MINVYIKADDYNDDKLFWLLIKSGAYVSVNTITKDGFWLRTSAKQYFKAKERLKK